MENEKLRPAKNLKTKDDLEVIHVSPESSFQKTAFTSPATNPMLAPETWDRIFRNLHSTDFLSVINSVPMWNILLSSRKIVELFPHALPFIMEFLPKNDFLKMRLACRTWKQGLDSVYENHPSRLAALNSSLYFPTPYKEITLLTRDSGVQFHTLASFQRFTTSMSLDSGNPFPGRFVSLLLKWEDFNNSDDEDDDDDDLVDPIEGPEYWTALSELLTQFGEHIWYLQLDYKLYDSADSNVEARLKNILHLLPNLKSLDLTMQPHEDICFEEDEWTSFNDRVIAFFEEEPPSKLDKLEMFSFTVSTHEYDSEIYPVILQLVKSYCANGNLKRLDLQHISYGEPIPLPELLELTTSLDFNVGPKLKEVSPKLEKLTVRFPGITYEDMLYEGHVFERKESEDEDESDDEDAEYWNCNISTIFDALHRFADTLKELTIEENVLSINHRYESYKVELPKLERLCFNYTLPIHHLFALKSLKYLKIDDSPVFENRKYGAGLFKQLPKLRKVEHKNGFNWKAIICSKRGK